LARYDAHLKLKLLFDFGRVVSKDVRAMQFSQRCPYFTCWTWQNL